MYSCHAWPQSYDHRPLHPYDEGTRSTSSFHRPGRHCSPSVKCHETSGKWGVLCFRLAHTVGDSCKQHMCIRASARVPGESYITTSLSLHSSPMHARRVRAAPRVLALRPSTESSQECIWRSSGRYYLAGACFFVFLWRSDSTWETALLHTP